jgi:PEP-CTERM motif
MRRLLLATGAVLCLSGAAHASITPTLVSITPDGSDFDFNYSVTLSGDEGLTTGSQLVIFDFAGYVLGSIASPSPLVSITSPMLANFDVTTGGVQVNPMFTDDPNIPDLVFTYKGPDLDTSGGPFAAMTVTFTATSTLGGVAVDGFSSRAISNSGMGTSGMASFNNGAVGVAAAAALVPEPASWAMLTVGFGGVGALLRDRRRRMAQSFA